YDAWGKVLSVTDKDGNTITDANHVANINPIRYRSYYYDTETGWYYLNSRYYDPSVKRFINADGVSLFGYAHQNITQYNMFAYCFNNPVGYYDPTGDFPILLGALFLGIVTYTAIAARDSLNNYESNTVAQQGFRGGFIDDQNDFGQFTMGRSGADDSGCGWIAAYNAMIMLGNPQDPADVIRYFDNAWGSLALGALGVNPFVMSGYFESQGYSVNRVTVGLSEGSRDFYSQRAEACVMLYTHSEGMHYIAYKWNGVKYVAYNDNRRYFSSVDSFIEENGKVEH
ncbi:MAG: RHS repeat-associated core domain-containing protein, partial [Clostridiales bacterium]|nr:RHS repeat-associated core domain-containing protein [Clostridiales bacterium]